MYTNKRQASRVYTILVFEKFCSTTVVCDRDELSARSLVCVCDKVYVCVVCTMIIYIFIL